MRSIRLFGNSSTHAPLRLMSFTLILLAAGLSLLGCGSSKSSNNGPPLDVAGTWKGTYDQSVSKSGSVSPKSVAVTLVVTQNGNSVNYSGTVGDGATWDCPNGTIDGTTITFPSCNATYSGCTATVTDRKDVIDDKAATWTMSPSYSYTWVGSCGVVTGYTVTVPASGETATLTKQ